MRTARRIATLSAAVTGAATFVGVAPFSCDGDGWCHGLVAFDYGPASPAVWQAVGAAAVVGGVMWLMVWLAVSPERDTSRGARVAASILLVAGAAISLLSHSFLVLAGPVVAGLFLWLIWARDPRRRGTFGVAIPAAVVALAVLYLLFPVSTIIECSAGCEVVGRRSAAGVAVPRAFTYAVPVALLVAAGFVYRLRA